MKDFSKPIQVTSVELAFPGNVQHLMPAYEEIPEEFHHDYNRFVKLQSKWFFEGLKDTDCPKIKPGIDEKAAWRHLSAIQGSWEPKHEHKMAAVAYLMSLWFE